MRGRWDSPTPGSCRSDSSGKYSESADCRGIRAIFAAHFMGLRIGPFVDLSGWAAHLTDTKTPSSHDGRREPKA